MSFTPDSSSRLARAQREAYRAAVDLAAEMGERDPTLRRVILFGSTLPGRLYRASSDIDLAVEGGDRALLERLVAGLSRPVDVIRLDDLRPGILERVLAEGVVLYEKK
mgnify:CR=1 FL=1